MGGTTRGPSSCACWPRTRSSCPRGWSSTRACRPCSMAPDVLTVSTDRNASLIDEGKLYSLREKESSGEHGAHLFLYIDSEPSTPHTGIESTVACLFRGL